MMIASAIQRAVAPLQQLEPGLSGIQLRNPVAVAYGHARPRHAVALVRGARPLPKE
jgi:hypothetical protein